MPGRAFDKPDANLLLSNYPVLFLARTVISGTKQGCLLLVITLVEEVVW